MGNTNRDRQVAAAVKKQLIQMVREWSQTDDPVQWLVGCMRRKHVKIPRRMVAPRKTLLDLRADYQAVKRGDPVEKFMVRAVQYIVALEAELWIDRTEVSDE